MDDPGSWCSLFTIVFFVLTFFFALAYLSLREILWVKVEEAFAANKHPERLTMLRASVENLTRGLAGLRMMGSLGFVLSILLCLSTESDGKITWSLTTLVEAFLIAAGCLLIFSVTIPHAWARYSSTSILVKCYPVLNVLYWLTLPLITLFKLFDPPIRRLAGVSVENRNGSLEDKQEELLNVVEEGEKEGVVDEEERDMIASVLEFRDTTVGEIMTPRTDVVALDVNMSFRDAVDTIISAGHSRYPVFEDSIDKVIGMLYAKDLLKFLNEPDSDPGIRQRLREPTFVPESKTVRDLLHDFQNQKVHAAVVLDEYGGTAGLVSIEDILEELVGEIEDEYEVPEAEPLVRIDENTLEVDARYHVDELNDEMDLELPEEDDYETIGGFACARLGHIPQAGESFDYGDLRFTVLDADQRRINRLRIDMLPQESANQQE